MMFAVGAEGEEQPRAFTGFAGEGALRHGRAHGGGEDEWHDDDQDAPRPWRGVPPSRRQEGPRGPPQKPKQVAALLQNNAMDKKDPNGVRDLMYPGFLLFPLNLLFYVIWTQTMRTTGKTFLRAQKAMGKKNTIAKVTRLEWGNVQVDKEVEKFASKLAEVELAEVESLRPTVDCDSKVTLRGRLKGTCLRADGAGVCDSNGNAFTARGSWGDAR